VAFPPKLLNDGEDAVLDLHPHWWFFAKSLGLLVGLIVLGIVAVVLDLADFVNITAGVLVLVALIWFGVTYLRWSTTNFVVTTDRLIYRHGVLTKQGIEIPLDRVNTVFFRQSLFERMLGAGDLMIESAGERGSQSFSDVRKPSAVQNEIYRQIEANENRKFDRVAAGGGGELSVPEQLEKLHELHERGVLSDDEYAEKKQTLLDRM
jgi:uncharacterized membrane protein YdbT with pleckstrin-like domain